MTPASENMVSYMMKCLLCILTAKRKEPRSCSLIYLPGSVLEESHAYPEPELG